MAMVISITNRKGGVGKSTMATHIAAGLAIEGLNVALVDTDSQGHSSLMLGMPETNGLFEALIDKKPLEEVVQTVAPDKYTSPDAPPRGNLYLLPSSALTYRIPHMLNSDETFLFIDKLDELAVLAHLDTIIIDTAPTMGLFDGSIYMATDAYIYVTECERLSFDGISKAVTQMRSITSQRKKFMGRESVIGGIIPNKMRANTINHRKNIEKLARAFPGLVWSPVVLATIWTEATNAGELVYTYAPSGQEAEEAYRITEKTMEVIQTWTANAAAN
jgi:chromosome partitioning protein